MALQKEIIVLGDIEMGGGSLTDDFIADRALSELILAWGKRDHPLDLVFNGDTFDFLKCPSQIKPKTVYPRYVTKEVSLAKLKLIYKAHRPFFEALKKLAASPRKAVYFNYGNHDPDLAYPEVQEEIKRWLGNTEKVRFPGLKYKRYGIHIEHGHQYDLLFAMNYAQLFLHHKGLSFLNLPFVSLGLISAFMKLKEKHPFLERIFPRPELFTHHRIITKEVSWRTLSYFFKSLVYYPFRFYSDPTYSFPTNLFREFFRRLRTLHWDVDDITQIFRKKAQREGGAICVLGHLHEKRISKGSRRVVIHPGSWRDEYDFQVKTGELVPRSKRYVQIQVTEDQIDYQVIDLPHQRSTLRFTEVLGDEFKFLKLAAKEEGYHLKM